MSEAVAEAVAEAVISKEEFFGEAMAHCRWKKVLRESVLSRIEISRYSGSCFEEVYEDIAGICREVKGVGELTVYDMVAAICCHFGIRIDRVYIVGNGPKRAIELLEIKTKRYRFGRISLPYVKIEEIHDAFKTKGFPEEPPKTDDGDEMESWICNWQKLYRS
jgi:hypothetical protein